MNDKAINFKTGESVKVKEGIMCPDLEGLCIGGWQGRISEIVEDKNGNTNVCIYWDSVTLRGMPDYFIEQSEDVGLNYTKMFLGIDEVEPAKSRDSEEEVQEALNEISERLLNEELSEEDRRIIEKYKKYKRIGIELNHKIMRSSCLNRNTLLKSGKLLGIVRHGTFVFDSEDETSVLMEFALNERGSGKTVVEIYREKVGGENDIEKEILDGLISSYTSLFKVVYVSERRNRVVLHDLLNKRENTEIIDISFSKTGIPGMLVFIRLISLQDFNKTSGVSFAFQGNREEEIIRKYQEISKRIKSRNESLKRFVAFYKLSKTHGIEVSYF